MYDELKANVFSKLPKRIVQMSVFVREMKQFTFISLHIVFHFILMYLKEKKSSLFFLHKRVELKLPKKNVCKTFCNTFCTILGRTAMLTYGKLMYTFSYLWTMSSDIASIHFE